MQLNDKLTDERQLLLQFFSIAVLIISGDVGLFMMQMNKTADLQLESGMKRKQTIRNIFFADK